MSVSVTAPVPVEVQHSVVSTAQAEEDKALAPFRQYLGDQTLNRERLTQEAAFYIEASGRSAFEAGVRIRVLRAGMSHGDFAAFVDQHLPCSYDHARTLCAIADRGMALYRDSSGRWQIDKIRQLDCRKISLVSRISELNPEELAAEGTVDGLTLDDIALTPRAELEKRARQLEADKARLHKQIEQGKKQLGNERDLRLHKEQEIAQLREASTENINARCAELRKELVAAQALFARTLPRDQKVGPIQLTALAETSALALTIGSQIANLIHQLYPEVEHAAARAEGHLTATELAEAAQPPAEKRNGKGGH